MNFTDFRSSVRASHVVIAVALALTAFTADAKAAASFDTLYSFPQDAKRGTDPVGTMVRDSKGALYGVTITGGIGNDVCMGGCGVVYQLTPTRSGSWRQTILHKFAYTDGGHPNDGLVIDTDGTLYGTTSLGGSTDGGTAFSLTPPATGQTDWMFETIHEFDSNSTNDHTPYGKLMIGGDGALYGMDGTAGMEFGTVFRIKKTKTGWAYRALYRLSGGLNPQWGLVEDTQGRLYGVGANGGPNDRGVVFRLTPPASGDGAWTYKVLHAFSDDAGDATNPQGTLVLRNDALYGQAYSTRSGSPSVIFRITLPSTFEIIYTLNPDKHGNGNGTELAMDQDGVIYGLAASEGPGGSGTLFKLMPPASGSKWKFRLLHAFEGTPDGRAPYCGPLLAADGSIYVNAQFGGAEQFGAVFAYRP